MYLLNLNGLDRKDFSDFLIEYLEKGEEEEIDKRYKCASRKRWYDVPIVKNGEICFFKRYNKFPRLIINENHIYTTDIAYNIRFFDKYDPKSFAFCFYNSLTLTMCEYYGRFYGGGVGELVPSEFKALPIPYTFVDMSFIKRVDEMICKNERFENIIDFVDKTVLDLNDQERRLLRKIRNRFLQRRLNGRFQ